MPMFDINVAHRLGANKKQNLKKPMIVKLHSCLKKDELMSTCVTIKPNIYINEASLCIQNHMEHKETK